MGPVLFWLNLDSKAEVDEFFAQWKAAQAKTVSEPEDKPWKLREFMAADLMATSFVSSMISGATRKRTTHRARSSSVYRFSRITGKTRRSEDSLAVCGDPPRNVTSTRTPFCESEGENSR
jgi:hypothetical protein